MTITTRLAAGALMATLVAVPATAEAKPVSKVRTQVVAADKSLDRVVSLAKQNRDSAAARELRAYRRHLRRAETELRRQRRSAGSTAGATTYGRSVRMVGSVANECADSLSQIVGQVGGDPQVAIAQAIKACIVTRERVVEILTQLLPQLPAEARPYLAQVIALLSSDGKDEVQALTVALGNPALPVDVAAILTQALGLATDAINDAIGRLQGIVGMLPASVQPIVNTALTLVTDQLGMVTTLVQDLFTGLFGGTPTAPGGVTGGGSIGGLFGAGGMPGLNVLQTMFANR